MTNSWITWGDINAMNDFYEMKQCPYCGRWLTPYLKKADFNTAPSSNSTVYVVAYPVCFCRHPDKYYWTPNDITTAGDD